MLVDDDTGRDDPPMGQKGKVEIAPGGSAVDGLVLLLAQ